MNNKSEEEHIQAIMKEYGVGRLTAEQMRQVEIAGGDVLAVDREGKEQPHKGTQIDEARYE